MYLVVKSHTRETQQKGRGGGGAVRWWRTFVHRQHPFAMSLVYQQLTDPVKLAAGLECRYLKDN